jgi:hypothetical protein
MDMEQAVEVEVVEDDDPTATSVTGLEELDAIEEAEDAVEEVDEGEFDRNLAEDMDEADLTSIAEELVTAFDEDLVSRKEWEDMYVKGLEVLGLKHEERTIPFKNACGVYSPLLTEAALRFQSEMITETFPAAGPVKTQTIGEETPEVRDAAERVREDMNYRLTEEMIEYRPEHERMLWALGLIGAAFKKIYKDPALGRQTAMFIPAEDLVIPYGASSVYTAERATLIMRKTKNELRKMQVSGFYRDIELGEPTQFISEIEKKKADEQGFTLIEDNRYQILEIVVDRDLKGYEDKGEDGKPTGVALPYLISVDRGTQQVMSIRRNWREGDENYTREQHFVQYTYAPGFGAYGMGFVHLIGGYARAGTSLIRQLVDAGTLANLPGGLKSRGMRILGDDTPIEPGEFRDVDIPVGTVRDNIMPLPYKEPSAVLAGLLEKITDDGRRVAGSGDLKISDMSAQAPVGTTLALLERQLKIMSAVQARVHASLRMEFKLLKQIIRDDMPPDYSYVPEGGNPRAKQADYDLVQVLPVSDPNAATMAQRIMQYQAAMQMAQQAPQIYDQAYLHRQMLEVLGIKNAEKLVPLDEDQKPRDPVSENMSFLTGKPAKAFLHQDHNAHIATHMALIQDPMVMQMIGQTPAAQQIMGGVMAHVSEHLAFSYRAKIEQMLGVPLTPPDAELDPQTEIALSRVIAPAAQALLQGNQQKAAQAAQQQAEQQAAMDPKMKIEMAKVEVKQAEVQQKAQDSERDFEVAKERLELERQRMSGQLQNEQKRLMSDMQREAGRLRSQERQNDKRIRADVVKTVMKPKPPAGKPAKRTD